MRALSGFIHKSTVGEYRDFIPVKGIPERVALVLNEEKFRRLQGAMIHHDTIFLLDRMHDWEYDEKRKAIRVFGSIDPKNPLDILIAYSVTQEESPVSLNRMKLNQDLGVSHYAPHEVPLNLSYICHIKDREDLKRRIVISKLDNDVDGVTLLQLALKRNDNSGISDNVCMIKKIGVHWLPEISGLSSSACLTKFCMYLLRHGINSMIRKQRQRQFDLVIEALVSGKAVNWPIRIGKQTSADHLITISKFAIEYIIQNQASLPSAKYLAEPFELADCRDLLP